MVNSDDAQAIKSELERMNAQLKHHSDMLQTLKGGFDVFHARDHPDKKTNAEQIIDALKVVQAIALIGVILKRLSAIVILIAATWAALKGVLPK